MELEFLLTKDKHFKGRLGSLTALGVYCCLNLHEARSVPSHNFVSFGGVGYLVCLSVRCLNFSRACICWVWESSRGQVGCFGGDRVGWDHVGFAIIEEVNFRLPFLSWRRRGIAVFVLLGCSSMA